MGANTSTVLFLSYRCFNPRARDGRELSTHSQNHYRTRFNPRARDGREQITINRYRYVFVSIHAPVMDAK